MRTVLITSDSLRHKYIAACLSRMTELQLIISEKKAANLQDTSGLSSEDAAFMTAHFLARQESEMEFFSVFREFPLSRKLLELQHGEVNSEETFRQIKEVAPDLIILFGSSIIKPPLLEEYPGKIINLHLGLSPYYKGSATNLFPYYYEEPECIGATIHLATADVDDGAILTQLRPVIKPNDDLHLIGTKAIFAAGQLLARNLEKYVNQEITPRPALGGGRICRNKELTPEVLRRVYQNFDKGMIAAYLENKELRDKEKPIINH